MVWRDIEDGETTEKQPIEDDGPSPGATLAVPFSLEPGSEKRVKPPDSVPPEFVTERRFYKFGTELSR